MKSKQYFLIYIITLLISSSILKAQDGGMWIPSLIEDLNIDDMNNMGLKISSEQLYSINNSSIKDAVVHFGGGCTGEMISPQGLLLTNHHCGYGQIQAHSSLENNYLENGFWAKNKNEELKNPGLTATFIISINDVSSDILLNINDDASEKDRRNTIQKNIEKVKKNIKKEKYQDVSVKAFFDGNQYFAFITETYKDVRLVGAPPSSIGKFGSDTDNWVWPRHTGDFSIFRVYASKNNTPAEYSEDNIPYTPKYFLPISLDGVDNGDFTMVYGFPGRTQEYLPSIAIKQIEETINPARIDIRAKALKIVDNEMRTNVKVKIQYASKYARIANYWKKWIGENKGLKASNAVEKRKQYEVEFKKTIDSSNDMYDEYSNLIDDLEKKYDELEKYKLAKIYFDEIAYRNIEILKLSLFLNKNIQNYGTDINDKKFTENIKPKLEKYANNFYKNYNANVDKKVFAVLIKEYMENVNSAFLPNYLNKEARKYNYDYNKLASDIFDKSKLTNQEDFSKSLKKSPSSFIKNIKKDPIYMIAQSMIETYNEKVKPQYSAINSDIIKLQRVYMKAQIEVFNYKDFFPDANSTLRITWGKVDGYKPKNAVSYSSKTYLKGIMEKYIPNDYEFDVPKKLRELYNNKDFGIYGENGKMPICFIATNHTTGGNSGSPALDAYGNLIGLNFDRAWEGTMSDINYDAKICRNIMVDIKYILFIIDKYAGAKYLIDEMNIVHPKK